MLDEKLKYIEETGERPFLLLHACCAPCTSHTVLYLEKYFKIALYFFNPNIYPESEYIFRKSELCRFISETGLDREIKIIDGDYCPEKFFEISAGLENLPERGERCRRCIALRLEKTGLTAQELRADFFTTTLTISPHKDSDFINKCGGEISEKCGVEYLFSDFKKHDGYKHSIELSKKYDLYRQNYCGCVYSKTKRTP